MKEILNTKDVAELLQKDIRTIQRKAENNEFPKGVCSKFGRSWIFHKENLMQYLFG